MDYTDPSVEREIGRSVERIKQAYLQSDKLIYLLSVDGHK